ncbi:hypothetical protein [Streptomyces halstedii]
MAPHRLPPSDDPMIWLPVLATTITTLLITYATHLTPDKEH